MKGYFKILWMWQVVSMQFVCLSWFLTSTRASKCHLYCSKQQDRDTSICLLDKEHKGQETYKKSPSFDHWFIWYPPLTLNWLSTGTGWALLHRLYIIFVCHVQASIALLKDWLYCSILWHHARSYQNSPTAFDKTFLNLSTNKLKSLFFLSFCSWISTNFPESKYSVFFQDFIYNRL